MLLVSGEFEWPSDTSPGCENTYDQSDGSGQEKRCEQSKQFKRRMRFEIRGASIAQFREGSHRNLLSGGIHRRMPTS